VRVLDIDLDFWMTTETNSRTLDRQIQGEEQAAALERLVGVVSVFVLGQLKSQQYSMRSPTGSKANL
jgi:hypothetical protein